MEEVKPPGFLFFPDSKSEFGMEAYHSFLVGGSISIMGEDGGWELFLWPVISGHGVMIDEISSCSRVEECSGVSDFS